MRAESGMDEGGVGEGPPAGGLADWRYGEAGKDFRIAWEYLLPDRPMTRRVDTSEVYSVRRGMTTMDVDVNVPNDETAGSPDRGQLPLRCFMPVALLSKFPVAPDLEVRDRAGAVVSVPTRLEAMALTARAFSEIDAHAASVLGAPSDRYHLDQTLQAMIENVIAKKPLHARVCRLKIAEIMSGPADDWLLPLLHRLESRYLLWVPVEGLPGSEHRLSIRRSAVRDVNPIFPELRGPETQFTVESAIGPIVGEWNPPRKWLHGFDISALVGRLLLAFGLMPVKFEDESVEAQRFSSYHTCIVPPRGLLLREVKAGRITDDDPSTPNRDIHELNTSVDRTIQGEDTQTGHVHCAMDENPSRLYSRVTIGMRPGTTTLWALVAVLTCGLLWAFHRDIRRLAQPASNLDIAVAVLLVGPTFASAWTLREKDRALLRSMLSGTRLLLLTTAMLSVGTALALAGLRPFGWHVGRAVEWYASLSYTIATLIAIGWLQARSITWFVYRKLLTATKWNLVATIGLAFGACISITQLSDFPAPSVVLLFVAGFGFSAIAGNRASVPMGEVSRVPAAVAGIGAIVTLALASRELGFYNRLADRGIAHEYGVYAELAVAGAALLVLCIRYCVRLYRRKRTVAAEKPIGPPAPSYT